MTENKKHLTALLFLIVALGIFLRTFNFSDWLKFNSDQARDAGIVLEMVRTGNLPLLGPVAGGTLFKLGPAFYYFQYTSAKIFGAEPDKLAYPDLLFGVASILLFFLLLGSFFEKKLTLGLTALFSVAFFMVQYSRFAWNPNSTIFFDMLFLYAFLRLAEGTRKRWVWIILAGIAMGVGVQLHTLLLFGLPFVSIMIVGYLLWIKKINYLAIVSIFGIAIILNLTQIKSELLTSWSNYGQFKLALVGKSQKQSPLWKNAAHVVSCQIQSNAKILVPYRDQESCESPLADKYFKRLDKRNKDFADWAVYVLKFIVAMTFSCFGYYFWWKKIKDKNGDGSAFVILGLFSLGLLLVFVPFGAEISLRYFIMLGFIPFVILGLCAEFVLKKYGTIGKRSVWSLFIILALYNLVFCIKIFQDYANDKPGSMVEGTFRQAELMAGYIFQETGPIPSVFMGGYKTDIGRFVNRVAYFTRQKGLDIVSLEKNTKIESGKTLFMAINDMSEKCKLGEFYKYGRIEKCEKMFDVTILKIRVE